MKKLILTLAVAALSGVAAKANPPGCATCGTGGGGGWHGGGHGGHGHFHKYDRFTGWFHGGGRQYKPQPAPWYLYWPYNGQFMTPFPVPPAAPGTGTLVNPYFPGH
jgi:hypothetical protein